MTSVLPVLTPTTAPWCFPLTDGHQQSTNQYSDGSSAQNSVHQSGYSTHTLGTVEHANSRRQSARRSAVAASRSQRRKRVQSEDDENEEEPQEWKREINDPTYVPSSTLLACPFHKFDPAQFGQGHYLTCGKGWSQMTGIVQHLNRAHRPCSSDRYQHSRQFESVKVDSHTGAPSYITQDGGHRVEDCRDGRMTHHHKAQIRALLRRKRSSIRLWYDVFATLFPSRIPPSSPYVHYNDLMPSKIQQSGNTSTCGAPPYNPPSLSHERQRECDGTPSTTSSTQRKSKPLSRSSEVFWPVVSHVVRRASLQFLSAWAIDQMLATAGAVDGQERTKPAQSSSRTGTTSANRISKTKSQKPGQNKNKRVQRSHRHEKRDGDNSEDELPERPSSDIGPEAPSNLLGTLLKCPYYVHDPFRYSETNTVELEYRSCQTAVLRDIARMKQHLERDHKRPDYFCPRCFVVKKSQAELGDHLRRSPICDTTTSRDFSERMTDEQFHEIKRKRVGGTIKEKYDECYEILFPGEAPPSSPFCDGTSYEFRAFLDRHLPIILERSWRETGYAPSPSLARDIASIVTQNVLRMIQTPLNIAQINIEALSAGLVSDLTGQAYLEPPVESTVSDSPSGQPGNGQEAENHNEVQPLSFGLGLDLDQPNEFDQIFEEWYNDMRRNASFPHHDFAQLGSGINAQVDEPLLSYQSMVSPHPHDREAVQQNLRSRQEEQENNAVRIAAIDTGYAPNFWST